jgi:hypothetical protein
MERETIERLAMDRALGELDADATALFDAYLAEHPEMQGWASDMSQTCLRTREAVAQKTQAVRAEDTQSETHVHRLRTVPWRALARWAAVVLISLGIGAQLGRQSRPKVSAPGPFVVQAPPAPVRAGWDRVMGATENGFWQAKALAMVQPKAGELARPRVARKGLWDRYRQTKRGAEL